MNDIPRAVSKKEFRAVWVATVRNLDIPVARTESDFENSFSAILDALEDRNMNAVIFQVRPALDAFYPSRINPWSEFLTGKQGESVLGGWDPLALMIAAAHKRGLEYHAWLNPYRVTCLGYTADTFQGLGLEPPDNMPVPELVRLYAEKGLLAPNNFAVLHPRMVYRHNRLLYLDAGFPEVRRHVVETVEEIIQKYDVDAVHFDDYFYPYDVPVGAMIDKTETAFELHGAGFPDNDEGWGNWLRHNNDEAVRGVCKAVRAENAKSGRAVQFGISPFGIWWNRANHLDGSSTGDTGFTFTGGVYADTRKWVLEEWVDYIAPQLYWEFDHPTAPYAELVRWWANLCDGKNVHLYIGHGNYKHATAPFRDLAAWRDSREIPNQLIYNAGFAQVNGGVFFAFNHINNTDASGPDNRVLVDSSRLLREHWRKHMPVVPAKPWLLPKAPAAPRNATRHGDTVTWEDNDENNARYYAVYRVAAAGEGNEDARRAIRDPSGIVARVWREGRRNSFTDANAKSPERFTYIVTAFNAAHVESSPAVASVAKPEADCERS